MISKAGVPRTKEKIVAELEKQVKLACAGVAKPVKDSQTKTGVKDMYTQYWIDFLLSRFKELKKDEPDRDEKEIQAELVQWALDNRDKIYSAFLTMKGVIWGLLCQCPNLLSTQDSIRLKIPQWKSCTPYCSESSSTFGTFPTHRGRQRRRSYIQCDFNPHQQTDSPSMPSVRITLCNMRVRSLGVNSRPLRRPMYFMFVVS